jgi:hypothetical protein
MPTEAGCQLWQWIRGLQRDVENLRCCLSWLTNSALVYEPKCGGIGRGRVAGSLPMSSAVNMSPNKLWRSKSIFNLCSGVEVAGRGASNPDASAKAGCLQQHCRKQHQRRQKQRPHCSSVVNFNIFLHLYRN